MPDQISNYQCPSCTGPLHFDSTLGKLHCDYCGSSFEVAEIEALFAAKNEQAAAAAEAQADTALPEESVDGWNLGDAGSEWGDAGAQMRAYNCPSCGAQLICDETTAATSCPYCDNPTVLPATLAGSFKPDLIIPFRLDKQQAKDAFRRHLKGKKLLPKLFSEESHLDEIKGVYVPFWLFDADADANLRYSGQRLRAWSDRDYNYTEISFFELDRGGTLCFRSVPVDGSQKIDNLLTESIEPFDTTKAVDFKTAYLAGYIADRYDVKAEACVPRANARMQQSVKEAFLATTGNFTAVAPKSSNIRIENGTAKYALFPVWILNTTWRGEQYRFAMNGQTGKFVGNLPCDKALQRKWQLIYGGAFAAALYAIEWLIHLL